MKPTPTPAERLALAKQAACANGPRQREQDTILCGRDKHPAQGAGTCDGKRVEDIWTLKDGGEG